MKSGWLGCYGRWCRKRQKDQGGKEDKTTSVIQIQWHRWDDHGYTVGLVQLSDACSRHWRQGDHWSVSWDFTTRSIIFRERGWRLAGSCKARYWNRMSSVCLSVTLVDCDHIGWNSCKIISPLVSLGCSLSADPNIRGLLQGEHAGVLAQIDPHPLLIWASEIFDHKLWLNGYR